MSNALTDRLAAAIDEAERKAYTALGGYKFKLPPYPPASDTDASIP